MRLLLLGSILLGIPVFMIAAQADASFGVLRFLQYATQEARQAVFWARYYADDWNADSILTEHILLGLLHEDPSLVTRFLSPEDSIDNLRAETLRSVGADPESASVGPESIRDQAPELLHSLAREIPLGPEGARVLTLALQVADDERSKRALETGGEPPPAIVLPTQGWSGGPPPPELIEAMRQMEAAGRRGDPGYVKPRHLLIAFLSMPGTPSEQILTSHGLRLEDVRQALAKDEGED